MSLSDKNESVAALAEQLEATHMAVVDAANEWELDENHRGARAALRDAVRAWRKAGEAFAQGQQS